jgi:Arc/MetJ-type ribon-helix-helix transcriptional regulator
MTGMIRAEAVAMTLTLNPKLQKLIDDRVKSGKYRSKEDVIAAALHSLDQQERLGDFEPGELDELCNVEKGNAIDAEEVFREIDALRDAALKKERQKRKSSARRGVK